jgi:hypothetical protein
MKMLTRRRLITTSIQVALVGTLLPLLSACSEPVSENVLIGRTPLLDFLLDYTNVSFAGPTCALKLGLQPDADPFAVQQELSATLEEKLASQTGDDDIGHRLQEAIQSDFNQDRILDIDGWQLSETECQAAALAASMQGFNEPIDVEQTPPVEMKFVEIENWGPQRTLQGESFNEQPDGHSGIWVKAIGIPASTVLLFSGVTQPTNVYAEHLTSGLRGKFMNTTIGTPGTYTIDLYDRSRHRIQRIGEFEVIKRTAPIPFYKCRVADWGPQQATSGEAFNEQPNGASAFWIRTNCALPEAVVVLNDRELKTTIRPNDGLITASLLDGHELPPGQYKVELHYGDGGNMLQVGALNVAEILP